jgi:NAD(P)H dehydrogenase (quinone)
MNSNKYITLFGATGKIGGELLGLLSTAQIPTIAVTRNKDKAINLPLVTWVEADMRDPATLDMALTNSKAIFLVSSAGERMVEEQCNVIDAAVRGRVNHIVKLSSSMADPESPLFIPKAHGQIEEHLRSSGLNATVLRPEGFMQNWLLGLVNSVKSKRTIYEATGDGKRAYIDLRDSAEAAFRILLEPEQHIGHTYLLTGGKAINYDQLADIITENIGEPVQYVPITAAAAKQSLEQRGVPSWNIELFLAYYEDQLTHKTNFIGNDIASVLQKPARTVESFVSEHIKFFK